MAFYRFKFLRTDLQRELIERATRAAIPHQIDNEGFVRITSDADVARLEAITAAIERHELIEPWHALAEERPQFDEKMQEQIDRGVPYIEFEVEGDHEGSVHHWFGLAIRRESSLPRSQRPEPGSAKMVR
jgi:hypothetical protein